MDKRKKTLLDIQKEVRKLEKDLHGISANLSRIDYDLSELRKNDQDLETLDYNAIKLCANNIRFNKHPIKKVKDDAVSKIYILTLLSILQFEKNDTKEMLIFIQWILNQTNVKESLQKLLKESYKYSKDNFMYLEEKLQKNYLAYLITDMMITSNVSGTASDEALLYIIEIATIFRIGKDKIKILSLISKCTLEQTAKNLRKNEAISIYNAFKQYGHYITEEIKDELIIKARMRYIAVSEADSNSISFKWKVKKLKEVSKGDLIAEIIYTSRYGQKNKTKKILAPKSGTLYQFRDKCINYGVIACKNDNKDSIKAWVKKMRGKTK